VDNDTVSLPAAPFVPAETAAPAHWVTRAVAEFNYQVDSLLPRGFDAYTRILHPAANNGRVVRWSEIARTNGRTPHRLMQWPGITGIADMNRWQDGQPGVYDEQPEAGSLPADVARVLVEVLRTHTSTPDRCCFALWYGFGGMEHYPRDAEFELPARKMWLYNGPLDAAAVSMGPPGMWHQSANMWWPDDRTWCVATDIDLISTYVGSSAMAAEQLLNEPRLEAVPARTEDLVTLTADIVNPYPGAGS
jgi:hypothetical protein